jgi:lipoate-protein ligase A
MLFDAITYLDDRKPHDAALNMAIDEELLRNASKPLLRIYLWDKPAVSFGYFGRLSEVRAEWPGRELVRRWTGGGIVPHGADLTYTLIVPKEYRFGNQRALESYAVIHELIAGMISTRVGAPIALAPAAAPKISGACFENPAQHDIMLGADKVAGAAQRRTQSGLLHQGSIQLADLPPTFGHELASAMAPTVTACELDADLAERAASLAESKYRTDAWMARF